MYSRFVLIFLFLIHFTFGQEIQAISNYDYDWMDNSTECETFVSFLQSTSTWESKTVEVKYYLDRFDRNLHFKRVDVHSFVQIFTRANFSNIAIDVDNFSDYLMAFGRPPPPPIGLFNITDNTTDLYENVTSPITDLYNLLEATSVNDSDIIIWKFLADEGNVTLLQLIESFTVNNLTTQMQFLRFKDLALMSISDVAYMLVDVIAANQSININDFIDWAEDDQFPFGQIFSLTDMDMRDNTTSLTMLMLTLRNFKSVPGSWWTITELLNKTSGNMSIINQLTQLKNIKQRIESNLIIDYLSEVNGTDMEAAINILAHIDGYVTRKTIGLVLSETRGTLKELGYLTQLKLLQVLGIVQVTTTTQLTTTMTTEKPREGRKIDYTGLICGSVTLSVFGLVLISLVVVKRTFILYKLCQAKETVRKPEHCVYCGEYDCSFVVGQRPIPSAITKYEEERDRPPDPNVWKLSILKQLTKNNKKQCKKMFTATGFKQEPVTDRKYWRRLLDVAIEKGERTNKVHPMPAVPKKTDGEQSREVFIIGW